MTFTLTQHGLHAGLKIGQFVVRHESLDGPGKAAAVDPDGSLAAQQLLADG